MERPERICVMERMGVRDASKVRSARCPTVEASPNQYRARDRLLPGPLPP